MYTNYDMENQQPGRTIGSFIQDNNADFKNGVLSLMEGFRATYSMDVNDDFMKIVKNETLNEQYKDGLIGDMLNESFEDPYLNMMPEKLEQLYENTRTNIIEESYGVSNMSPVVAYSLPILKKTFLQCNAKDIMMTEVATKPVVKRVFERKFLRDQSGKKHYIPEIFYNDEYKKVSQLAKGKKISDAFYPSEGNLPMQDLPLLNLSGGTLEARDEFALDIHICEVKLDIDGVEHVEAVDIKPDLGANNSFVYRLTIEKDGKKIEEIVTGAVDFYHGTVSVSTTGTYVKKVKFGGHLSNQNNVNGLDIDRERESMTWMIPENERLNCGFTIEKIKDMKAMMNIDIVPEIISDMSVVLTQFKDSDMIDFVKSSLDRWKSKKSLPFGYTDGFVETATFNCVPDHGMLTQSDWIEKELKFRIDRILGKLKTKLKSENLMFTLFAHPNNVELINTAVRWLFDENTRIGGVKLDYKFGILTTNKARVHVVSSLKVEESEGLRIIAQPTTEEHITFKHFDYSLNIESGYRNPATPLIGQNIMATHRHKQIEVLPVQGQIILEGTDFGINTPARRR